MQHNKGKKSITEIQSYCEDSVKLITTFKGLLCALNLNYINTLLAKSKTKGIDTKKIFQILFSFPFLDLKNIHQLKLSGYYNEISFKKDVLYDFMKNPLIDWRRIVNLFCKQVISIISKESDSEKNKYLAIPFQTVPSFSVC